jgi:hypothetical protein
VRSQAAGEGHRTNATDTQVRRAGLVLEVNGTRTRSPAGLVVGRGTEADLRINDPGVSRRHIEFRRRSTETGRTGLKIEVQRPRLHQRHARRRPPRPAHHRSATDPGADRSTMGNTTMTVGWPGGGRMSELTLFLIRIAYLAILWIFVLSAISVIRSDMFGARVPEAAEAAKAARRSKAQAKAAAQASRRPPTSRWSRGQRRRARRPRPGPDPHRPRPRRGDPARRRLRLDPARPDRRLRRPVVRRGPRLHQRHLHRQSRITQPTTITLGTQVRIGKTILELRK